MGEYEDRTPALDEDRVRGVLVEVLGERRRQHAQWGEQSHADGTREADDALYAEGARQHCARLARLGCCTWRAILSEEIVEAWAAPTDAELRAELLQVAAVAVQWIEMIDRRR